MQGWRAGRHLATPNVSHATGTVRGVDVLPDPAELESVPLHQAAEAFEAAHTALAAAAADLAEDPQTGHPGAIPRPSQPADTVAALRGAWGGEHPQDIKRPSPRLRDASPPA